MKTQQSSGYWHMHLFLEVASSIPMPGKYFLLDWIGFLTHIGSVVPGNYSWI